MIQLRQEFCRFQPTQPVVNGDIVGIELEMMFGPYTKPDRRPRAPLQDATEGPPVQLAHDELASFVYSYVADCDGEVRIQELLYRDLSLSRIVAC